MLSWQAIDCPKCGAKKGDRCRSLTTNRVTDTHVARIDAYADIRFRSFPRKGCW